MHLYDQPWNMSNITEDRDIKYPFHKNLSAQGCISWMELYEAIIFSIAKITS